MISRRKRRRGSDSVPAPPSFDLCEADPTKSQAFKELKNKLEETRAGLEEHRAKGFQTETELAKMKSREEMVVNQLKITQLIVKGCKGNDMCPALVGLQMIAAAYNVLLE